MDPVAAGAGAVAATGESAATAIAVSTLAEFTKTVVEAAAPPLWVRGEVTGFKAHRNGHWYFTLRDATAQMPCVVWARDRRRIPAPPDEGMQVAALGALHVYAAKVQVSFAVTRLEAAGEGLWRKAFEQLRARLEAEGLLAPERKRPLPRFPRRIAVITSPDGAALHDIVAVARRRDPRVELVVVPAAVQGDGAPEALVAALERVGRWREADLVIIGRGGGSREDLWAFNDEEVARAVAACPLPIISAVGHEVDVTICDLVADWRAPTPSAAAERAVPALADLRATTVGLAQRMRAGLARRAEIARRDLVRAARGLAAAARSGVERRRAALQAAAGRLDALSPLGTLARGYAVARGVDGRPLTRAGDFEPGAAFTLTVRDGVVDAATVAVRPGGPG